MTHARMLYAFGGVGGGDRRHELKWPRRVGRDHLEHETNRGCVTLTTGLESGLVKARIKLTPSLKCATAQLGRGGRRKVCTGKRAALWWGTPIQPCVVSCQPEGATGMRGEWMDQIWPPGGSRAKTPGKSPPSIGGWPVASEAENNVFCEFDC